MFTKQKSNNLLALQRFAQVILQKTTISLHKRVNS
jgi:hypothetical protein